MSHYRYVVDPARLDALARTGLMEDGPAPAFDRAAKLASRILGTPVNLLALVNASHQLHAGQARRDGSSGADWLPIENSICRIVVATRQPLKVADARTDRQVRDYAVEPDEGVVAYLGIPVRAPDGHVLGSFCAVDDQPRRWTRGEEASLADLAALVENQIALLQTLRRRDEEAARFRTILDELPIGVALAEVPSANLLSMNRWGRRIMDEDIVAPDSRTYQKLGAHHSDGRSYDADEYPLVRAAVHGETVTAEPMRYRRANGSVIELEVAAQRIGTDERFAVATFVDTTARKRAEGSAAAVRDRLEKVLQASRDPILVIDRFWVVTFMNKAARETISDGRDLVEQDLWESFPDWVDAPIAEAYRNAIRTGAPGRADMAMPGSEEIYEARVFPGEEGLTVFFRDVTAERRMVEMRQLLVRELNHRVKNLFAVVGGMVRLTARRAGSAGEMRKALSSRIEALARAHELISPAISDENIEHPQVTLESLVAALVGPHVEQFAEQVLVDGPVVSLSPGGTTALSLALHELATNAAKYGSLSVPEGRLTVRWHKHEGNLVLVWRERNGPPIMDAPGKRGFGTTLTELAVTRQLAGTMETEWANDGLTATLTVRRSRVTGN